MSNGEFREAVVRDRPVRVDSANSRDERHGADRPKRPKWGHGGDFFKGVIREIG